MGKPGGSFGTRTGNPPRFRFPTPGGVNDMGKPGGSSGNATHLDGADPIYNLYIYNFIK